MRAKAAVLFALLAASTSLALLAGPALAADPVQIVDVDSAPRSVAPGANASFEWTVRNLDTIPYNVTVTISQVKGWTASVDSPRIVDLAPNRAASVRLTVQVPPDVAVETTVVFLVRFEVDDNGAVVFVSGRNATVTVPSALASKRVLGVFDNPLPAPLDNEYVGSSRVDLQACKLEYSIVSPK